MLQGTPQDLLRALSAQIELGNVEESQPPGFARVIKAELFPGRGFILPEGRRLQVTATIAVHWATTLFPFLGGNRVLFGVEPDAAADEAMGLASAMTKKNIWLALILANFRPLLRSALRSRRITGIESVLALLEQVKLDGVPRQYRRGGAKATLLFSVDPRSLPVEVRALAFMALGKLAATLLPEGAGQLSVDAGCSTDDMVAAALGCGDRRDRPFAGYAPTQGGHGDPSPITAAATLRGLAAAAKFLFGTQQGLKGLTVALEGGAGKVGSAIGAELLTTFGVRKLFVSDVDGDKLKALYGRFGDRVQIVSPQDEALYLETPWEVAIPASGRFQQFDAELARAIAEADEGRYRILAGPQNCMFLPSEVIRTTDIFHDGDVLTLDDAALSGGGVACVAGEGYNNVPPLSRQEQRENQPMLIEAIGDGFSLLISAAQELNIPPTALFYAVTDRALAVLDVGGSVFSPPDPAAATA